MKPIRIETWVCVPLFQAMYGAVQLQLAGMDDDALDQWWYRHTHTLLHPAWCDVTAWTRDPHATRRSMAVQIHYEGHPV